MSCRVASAVRRVAFAVGELCYCIGIIHFEEEIADLNLLQDLNVDLCDDARGRGICLKLVDGLDFSVGRDGADEILTGYWRYADFDNVAGR